jgi:hypothetical protein
VVGVKGFPFLLCLLVLLYSKASYDLEQLRLLPSLGFFDTNSECSFPCPGFDLTFQLPILPTPDPARYTTCQLGTYHTSGVHEVLHDQYIASHNGKHPWSTKALVRTVREIDNHALLSCGTFVDEYCHKCSQECSNQAIKNLDEAPES